MGGCNRRMTDKGEAFRLRYARMEIRFLQFHNKYNLYPNEKMPMVGDLSYKCFPIEKKASLSHSTLNLHTGSPT